MGVLTDVVVAKKTESAEVCSDEYADRFKWEEVPGLEVDELVSLLCILEDSRASKKFLKEFPVIYENPANDCCVTLISDRLVRHLAQLDTQSITKLANRWSEMTEDDDEDILPSSIPFRRLHGTLNQRIPVALAKQRLVVLRKLSKHSISKTLSMLLRQCP